MDNRTNQNKELIESSEFRKLSIEEKIMEVAGGFIPPSGKTQEEVLEMILNKTNQSKPVKSYSLNFIIRAVAAILILAFSVYSINTFIIHKKVKTQFAEQKEIKLPDGTQVTLNAGSQIIWNNIDFNKKRKVNLKGEAFFNVKKGDEFIINTNRGKVEILGTELNVYSRLKEFSVSCFTGKVRVTTNNQEQVLTPGDWVILNSAGLVKSKSSNIEKTISWKDGILHFEDTQLVRIFDELERQYDVNVVYKGNEDRLATVDFPNNNLTDALEVVCIPMELKYEIKNRKIIIYQKE
ncbi:MAG: FecR domain-containing protein [Prolixibacteraceae bacterium]|nr:FecR domain-containing protein [Prolixibacteraceae bacterium]MBN2775523.1 FecR domain-containing protein [Prolixibacteraceae bacterium]